MACKCDEYPTPDKRNLEIKASASLLIWLLPKVNMLVPTWVKAMAGNELVSDARVLPLLCKTMQELSEATRERLLYGNPRDAMARRLADWWEEHQEVDRKQAIKDAARRHTARVRAGALAKLTKEERQALGIIE